MAQEIGNSNLLEVWATSGAVVAPDISKIREGWQLGEQPPHEFMNWLQNTFGAKLNQLLSRGAPDWNSETAWPVAALVNYGGRVWFALSANTNSQPSAVNSNWKTIDDAKSILYDNSISGLVAENVQAAISELQDKKLAISANLSDLANAAAARQNLWLGTAATRDVGTAPGNVMPSEIGGIELNAHGTGDRNSFIDFHSAGAPYSHDFNARIIRGNGLNGDFSIMNTGSGTLRLSSGGKIVTNKNILIGIGEQFPVHHSGNILQTTGQSTEYPMTQKAVTDAINNSAIGVGQTWQDVTLSRVAVTSYTNSTGRSISVSVNGYSQNDDSFDIIVGGIRVGRSLFNMANWLAARTQVTAIVPPGETYSLDNNGGAINSWMELR